MLIYLILKLLTVHLRKSLLSKKCKYMRMINSSFVVVDCICGKYANFDLAVGTVLCALLCQYFSQTQLNTHARVHTGHTGVMGVFFCKHAWRL